ncbi:unnamed protein product, partial [Laminaria digitata]
MREEQIANGVKFLVHPKVKTAPLSQRISFLENKGLTPEEISTALSRVEGQGGIDGTASSALGGDAAALAAATAAAAGSGSFPSTSPPFLEATVPMWRKVAVPGALALGAVGALGTYYAASRSAGGRPSQTAGARQSEVTPHPPSGAAAATAAGGYEYRGEGLPEEPDTGVTALEGNLNGGPNGEIDYAQDSFHPSQRLEPRPGAGEPSALAGEFRRLTETMEQQTGHLVEAVGAMKALASRAEQDSNSLLAARISSHTSELRAELGNIKQLILLQAGGEAGGGVAGDVQSAASGAIGATAEKGAGATGATLTSAGVAKNGTENGGLKAAGEGVEEVATDQGKPVGASEVPPKSPEEKAKEGAALGRGGDEEAAKAAALAVTERRKGVARAALAALLADNAPQAAKDGIAMLRMLVANLVKQSNVPRYRRITTSNENFKKRLLPLEGHRAMMEAIGFKAKGSVWEWTWHEDSGPSASSCNKAVLEDIVAAIDAVARPNGPPLPSSIPHVPGTTSSSAAAPSATPTTHPDASVAKHTKGAAAATPLASGDAPEARYSAAVGATGGGEVGLSNENGSGNGRSIGNGNVNGNINGTVIGNGNDHVNGNINGKVVGNGNGSVNGNIIGNVVGNGNGNVNGNINGDVVGNGNGAVRESAARQSVLEAASEVNGVGTGPRDEERLLQNVAAPSDNAAAVSIAAADRKSAAAVLEPPGVRPSGAEEGGRTVEVAVAVADKEVLPPASLAEVAAALQRGEEPPGIRVVEDRLSADATSLAAVSEPSPPKPWETAPLAGATAMPPSARAGADAGAEAGVEAMPPSARAGAGT